MPILNPSIQHALLKLSQNDKEDSKNAINFYFRYLRIASRNIFTDYSTIEALDQFKKDLFESNSLIQDKFNCYLPEEDFDNLLIVD